MKKLLIDIRSCPEGIEWAGDKTWKEIFETCHCGDWLLWLFKKTNQDDLKLLTLVKGHVATTVKHLMKDQRSIDAVDAAIAFGNGEITKDQLVVIANASYTEDENDVIAAAADPGRYSDIAVYAADAYCDSDIVDGCARENNLLLTANIVRQYIPIDKWNISENGELIIK